MFINSNSKNVNSSESSVNAKESAIELEKPVNTEGSIPNRAENLEEKIQKLVTEKELLLQRESEAETKRTRLQQEITELKKHYSSKISNLESIITCLLRQIVDKNAQYEISLNSKSIEIERLRSMLSTQLALLEEQEQKNMKLSEEVSELQAENAFLEKELQNSKQRLIDEQAATHREFTHRYSDDSENDSDYESV